MMMKMMTENSCLIIYVQKKDHRCITWRLLIRVLFTKPYLFTVNVKTRRKNLNISYAEYSWHY